MKKKFFRLLINSRRSFFVLTGGFGFIIAWLMTMLLPFLNIVEFNLLNLTILWWIIGPLGGFMITNTLLCVYYLIKKK